MTWEDEVRLRVCWECGDPLRADLGTDDLVPATMPGWRSHAECAAEAEQTTQPRREEARR